VREANQGEADEQDDPGDELQKAGHPDAVDPGRHVDLGAALRVVGELLRTVDQVSGSQAKEPESERDERRRLEVDYRRKN
jgi:hypothetical protein